MHTLMWTNLSTLIFICGNIHKTQLILPILYVDNLVDYVDKPVNSPQGLDTSGMCSELFLHNSEFAHMEVFHHIA